MTKKKSKLVHAQLPPPYKIRMEVVSWGRSLFTKHSILLMKSGEVKTKKQNYLAFFLRHRLSTGSFLAPSCQAPSLLYLIAFLDIFIIVIVVARPTSLALAPQNISWVYGNTCFPIRTDHIVRPLDLNQKIPPSRGLGGWGKLQ